MLILLINLGVRASNYFSFCSLQGKKNLRQEPGDVETLDNAGSLTMAEPEKKLSRIHTSFTCDRSISSIGRE